MSNRRFCFALDLVNDVELIAQYERWHAPGGVWPEVIADIRAQGITSMEIWRTGTRMVMVVEADESYPRVRRPPARVTEWETLMSKFQKQIPGTDPAEKWTSMAKIFTLNPEAGP